MSKKSWSELFSEKSNNSTGNIGSATSVSHSVSNGSIIITSAPPSRPGSCSVPTSRPASCVQPIEEQQQEEELPEEIDYAFLNRPVHKLIYARPINNRGNRCYMISVLQALLHCAPFCNYFVRYFQRLQIVSDRFALLTALLSLLKEFTTKGMGCIDGEAVDEIFLALPESFSGIGFGEQMDAEEFLTVFLDRLAEELMELRRSVPFLLPFESDNSRTPADNDDGGEWLQMGPKQKISITRRTPVSQSPIHVLFAGSLRSTFKAAGPSRPSITFEPFTVLPVELIDAQGGALTSVRAALEHSMRLEYLSSGTKQVSFASLPPLLILQLKRFLVQPDYSFTKITRAVKIEPSLELNGEHFQLVAVVEHHGASLHGGHYTTNVCRRGEWIKFDDELKPQRLTEEQVTHKSAYLLFYERRE